MTYIVTWRQYFLSRYHDDLCSVREETRQRLRRILREKKRAQQRAFRELDWLNELDEEERNNVELEDAQEAPYSDSDEMASK